MSYQRGERATRIDFDYLVDEDALLIYETAIRSWDPPSGQLISSIERQGILKDLREAFDALGVKYRIRS